MKATMSLSLLVLASFHSAVGKPVVGPNINCVQAGSVQRCDIAHPCCSGYICSPIKEDGKLGAFGHCMIRAGQPNASGGGPNPTIQSPEHEDAESVRNPTIQHAKYIFNSGSKHVTKRADDKHVTIQDPEDADIDVHKRGVEKRCKGNGALCWSDRDCCGFCNLISNSCVAH